MFTDNTLLEARAAIEAAQNGTMGRNELRLPTFGAFRAHLDNTPLLIPGFDVNNLKKFTGQPVRIPVRKRGIDGTVGSTRKCAGTGQGATTFKNLNFITVEKDFAISYLTSKTTMYDYQAQFNLGIAESLRALYTSLDQSAVAHLETLKSTVNAGSRYRTALASAKRVPFADYNRFFGRLTAEMMSNDFAGLMDIVGSVNLTDAYSYVLKQREQNAQNLGFQVDDYKMYFDRFVADGAGVDSTAYVFTPGTVGVFPWANQLARDGKDIGTDVWTTFQDPLMGITWELKVKKGCGDSTPAVAGGEAD